MASFKGQAEHSVDSKGRIAIPAKMRSALQPEAKNTFVITRGFERCIFLYPLNNWEEKEAEFSGLNTFNSEARAFVRTILRWADESQLDGQGRVRLPDNLIEFTHIEAGGKALVIGALDRIEIWDPDVFDAYLNEQVDDYETLAERVMGDRM